MIFDVGKSGALNRRSVIAGAASIGLVGVARAADKLAERVACLEWTAAEMTLALGIAPIGVGDTNDYGNWVVEPPMPKSVADLGSRFEPNRELLYRLAPDLVIISRGYGIDAAMIEPIAPTFELTPIAPPGTSALRHAAAEMERLARATGREAQVVDVIAGMRRTVIDARERLAQRSIPPVCILSLFDERAARVYVGGLFGDVMQKLGLSNAWTGKAGAWGFAQVGIERLVVLEPETRLVILDPVPLPVRLNLEESVLWRNLPVVRAREPARIPAVWPFGGLIAASRFANELSKALSEA
ncbi:ABC transporter substrate-binding protein [Aureimonas altamirensis]|nr:ABC transporter substrate-binding protein [Aureimonas altamirensis]